MSSYKSFVSPNYKVKSGISESVSFKGSDSKANESSLPSLRNNPPAVAPVIGRRRGLIAPQVPTIVEDKVKESYHRRKTISTYEDDMAHIKQTGTMDSIRFCFFSSQEVANFSVVEVKESKTEGPNSVYDLRMGPLEYKVVCETCNEEREKCPGHFGHIALNVPIPHPLCSKSIINFLRCFCFKCHRLVMTESEIFLNEFHRLKSSRFEAIIAHIDKNISYCGHADCHQKLYKYSFDDDKYYKFFPNSPNKTELRYEEIFDIFSDICDDDIRLLGLKEDRYMISNFDNINDPYEDPLVHPTRLIIQNLPVLPPCARPYSITDNEKSHDTLTDLYKTIIMKNNELSKPEKLNEKTKDDLVMKLVEKIRILFDNSKKKATMGGATKMPIQGIKDRISSKQGHIRKYLLGKRTNFSARTVIGGDNTIGVNELIIPKQIAKVLSLPIEVTPQNLRYCQNLLDSGKVNTIIGTRDQKYDPDKVRNTQPTYYHMDDILLIPDENDEYVRCDVYTYLMSKHPEWFDASGVVIERGEIANAISSFQVIRREYVKTSSEEETFNESIEGSSLFEEPIANKKSTQEECVIQERLIAPRNNLKKSFTLQPGFKIERQAQDGDWVVFNRQPTLWKGSMQAKKIKILPGKTFRMSLCTTQAFNADHDGDKLIMITA